MRRLRCDLPYTFRAPHWRNWFRPIGLWVNRELYLRRRYKIQTIDSTGFEGVREKIVAGDIVLLAPNHADHADPHVMLEVAGREDLALRFMAAREVFESNKVSAWALQSMGVFSIDRDGPDLSAIKTSINLLRDGNPLVIYPEGEIYHHSERLDPLHEGFASILLKAASRRLENQQAWLVPVGIQFHHCEKVSDTFDDRLRVLEDRIGWSPGSSLPLDDRIIRLGKGVLALKEVEYLGEPQSGNIQSRLERLCNRILNEVEQRRETAGDNLTVPERVRALRYRIRKELLRKVPPSAKERQTLSEDLDRIFAALQAHSYVGDYMLTNPTLDRRAETIMKLEEDLLGFPTYPTSRRVSVVADSPIRVTDLIELDDFDKKSASGFLTARLEERLRELIRK